jgi:hypothetical protein
MAEQVGPNSYRILGPVPEGESWQFNPGEVVICTERYSSGDDRALVATARDSSK